MAKLIADKLNLLYIAIDCLDSLPGELADDLFAAETGPGRS